MNAIEILGRVTGELGPWWNVIIKSGYFLGFVLIVVGVVGFGSQDRRSMMASWDFKKPFMAIVAGVLLMNLFPFLDAISMSTFGEASANTLSYAPPRGDQSREVMLKFSVSITMLVGLAGVIKGIYGLYGSSQDPRQFWPSITHIIGGFMALNIINVFEMIGATMGGVIQDTIVKNITG